MSVGAICSNSSASSGGCWVVLVFPCPPPFFHTRCMPKKSFHWKKKCTLRKKKLRDLHQKRSELRLFPQSSYAFLTSTSLQERTASTTVSTKSEHTSRSHQGIPTSIQKTPRNKSKHQEANGCGLDKPRGADPGRDPAPGGGGGGLYRPQNCDTEQCALSAPEAAEILFQGERWRAGCAPGIFFYPCPTGGLLGSAAIWASICTRDPYFEIPGASL